MPNNNKLKKPKEHGRTARVFFFEERKILTCTAVQT
jgi:hypothetical protein